MASITGTGLQFPNNDILSGVIGPNYVARWAKTSMGNNGDFLGLEVTMPPAKSADSRYLIITEANADDSNQSNHGCGLRIWVQTQNGNSYWVNRQGAHEEYQSGGDDKYVLVHNMIVDDGVNNDGNNNSTNTHIGDESPTIIANETRKYRVYGNSNNGNTIWGQGVGRHTGWYGFLLVVELDGSICS